MAFLLEPTKYSYMSFAPTSANCIFINADNASYALSFQDNQQKFNNLAATWKHDTQLESSASELLLNDAYQKIIGMGTDALPYIFQDLKSEPNHWFWALKSITGYDPLKPRQMGDLDEMTKEWLKWGSSKGYV